MNNYIDPTPPASFIQALRVASDFAVIMLRKDFLRHRDPRDHEYLAAVEAELKARSQKLTNN